MLPYVSVSALVLEIHLIAVLVLEVLVKFGIRAALHKLLHWGRSQLNPVHLDDLPSASALPWLWVIKTIPPLYRVTLSTLAGMLYMFSMPLSYLLHTYIHSNFTVYTAYTYNVSISHETTIVTYVG